MTVTTSSYTTNSVQITANNETGSTNIITAVNNAIISKGWTLFDFIPAANFNPISTYVYRAVCADAVTFKFFILRWEQIKLQLYTSCAEGWDDVAHTPLNECWTGAGAFAQSYDVLTSTIFVAATVRHCVIWTFVNGQPGLWSGICEFERIAPEDTLGTPCFAWTNSLMIGTPYGQSPATLASNIIFSFPRTPDGLTYTAACNVYAPVTNRGMFPPAFPGSYRPGSATAIPTGDVNNGHLGSFFNVVYGWNSLASLVSPMSADSTLQSMPFGRAFNFGVTRPLGAALDTTTVLGDTVGGFPSGSGTSTNYLILSMNGGSESDAAYGSGRSVLTTGTSGSVILGKPIIIGTNVWLAASDGIRTYDINSGQGGNTTLRLAGQGGITDIVYDGGELVYGAAANGVVRINCNNFSTASVAIANGAGFLSIDNRFVYATSRSASVTPQCVSINRQNFTNSATYTLSVTPLTSSLGGFGTPMPSYTGTVYLSTVAGSAATNALRVTSFLSTSGVQLVNLPNPLRAVGSSDSPSGFYIDRTSDRIFLAVSTTTNGVIFELTSNLATAGTVATFGAATAGTGYVNGDYTNVNMVLSSGSAAFRYPVVNVTVASGAVTAITLVTGGLGVPLASVLTIPNTSLGGSGSGFSVPIATLVATPTFTTGATGAPIQSHMLLGTGSDRRGDLQITPFRGTHIITPRRPGIATASYSTKINFASPLSTTPGQPRQIMTSALSATAYPGGSCSAMAHNGTYLVSTQFIAAADNRVVVTSGIYNLTNLAGNQAGRLLVKA